MPLRLAGDASAAYFHRACLLTLQHSSRTPWHLASYLPNALYVVSKEPSILSELSVLRPLTLSQYLGTKMFLQCVLDCER